MNAPDAVPLRLTSFSHGGGCGCKIAPGVLSDILAKGAPSLVPPQLLVGIETSDDARQRMVFLRNDIANSELTVARYYFRRGAYVGAANRAKYIVENYQQAAQIPDALALMVQSYEALGQKDLADDARRVLEANAPDHPYLTGVSREGKQGWWSKLWPF